MTHLHTEEGRADAFLRDVKEAVAVIMKNPQKEVDGKVSTSISGFMFMVLRRFRSDFLFLLQMAMYGASQTLQDRSIVTDFTRFWIDALYYTPNDTNESLA